MEGSGIKLSPRQFTLSDWLLIVRAVTLALNNTWPDPVANVSVSEPTKVLFKPVYHVWGKYQTGFDGTPFTGEDGSTGIQHYFDQYWIRELNSPNILSLTK